MTRERPLRADVSQAFFEEIGKLGREKGLLSDEHSAVAGTSSEGWVGLASLRPRAATHPPPTDSDPGNLSVNFHRQRHTNDTHASTADADTKLYKKAKGQRRNWVFSATC